MDPLVRAHIIGLAGLRHGSATALTRIWQGLPAYDRPNLDQWISEALPVVEAAQRQAAALTNAYVARAMERGPVGVNVTELIGAAVRNGTPAETVYERPFISIWTALKQGTEWEQAVAAGLDRATSASAMDVQLSMRATADAIDVADPNLFGYKRVANPSACTFCKEVDGAYVKGTDGFVMALHNHCGCGLEALREPHDLARYLPDGTDLNPHLFSTMENVAIRQHGELGPVLVDPKQHFTSEADLAHAH